MPKSNAIEEELARQDAELAQLKTTLESLGDVELLVPQTVLDEIEELATPRNPDSTISIVGIRA
jgi:hypothetical protein